MPDPLNFVSQNLSDRSFKRKDLAGIDFTDSILNGCNFSQANLKGANFSGITTGLSKRQKVIATLMALLGAFLGIYQGFGVLIVVAYGGLTQPIVTGLLLYALLGLCTYISTFIGTLARKIVIIVVLLGLVAVVGALVFFTSFSSFLTLLVLPMVMLGAYVYANIGVGMLAGAVAIFFAFTSVPTILGAIFLLARDFSTLENILVFAVSFGLLVLGLFLFSRAGIKKIKYATGTSFRGADLTDANFTKALLKNCDFSEAILENVNWEATNRIRCRTPV